MEGVNIIVDETAKEREEGGGGGREIVCTLLFQSPDCQTARESVASMQA